METSLHTISTEDVLQLHGVLYQPEEKTDIVLVHVHGMGGNFYENKFLENIAKTLTDNGIAFFPFNNRGNGNITNFVKIKDDKKDFGKKLRGKSKPIVIAANKMDLPNAKENIEKLKEKFPEKIIVPCSGISELTLKKAAKDESIEYLPGEKNFEVKKDLNEKQKKGIDYIKENVLEKFGSTGVQDVLEKAVFDTLQYIAVFPGGTKKLSDQYGNILVDCFLLPPKSTALDFAFSLHTDFGEKFIKAVDVKTKQLIGKDHELKNRDVIEIIHGN